MPSNKIQIIEQSKFTYYPLGKVFEKQTKTIEEQGNKKIKATEDQGRQMVESNSLINRDCTPDEEQTKIFNELVEKRSSEFFNLEKRVNPDHLIYKYKTERRSTKDLRNYQNLIDLFKGLRDQINFTSDPSEIKKEIQYQDQKTK